MSEQKIFRQVLCSEGMPQKEGFYITDFGICSFDGERFWQQSTMIGADWWLEEVELPSEEDIIRKTVQFVKNELCFKSIDEIKESDAIELIKGEGLNNG